MGGSTLFSDSKIVKMCVCKMENCASRKYMTRCSKCVDNIKCPIFFELLVFESFDFLSPFLKEIDDQFLVGLSYNHPRNIRVKYPITDT